MCVCVLDRLSHDRSGFEWVKWRRGRWDCSLPLSSVCAMAASVAVAERIVCVCVYVHQMSSTLDDDYADDGLAASATLRQDLYALGVLVVKVGGEGRARRECISVTRLAGLRAA